MWGDLKHERRRGVAGMSIDEDDDEDADDTDTDEEEDCACSHRGLGRVATAAATAGEEDESSSGTVVAVKELENEEGSSIIATVRLVLRLVLSGIPYEERCAGSSTSTAAVLGLPPGTSASSGTDKNV